MLRKRTSDEIREWFFCRKDVYGSLYVSLVRKHTAYHCHGLAMERYLCFESKFDFRALALIVPCIQEQKSSLKGSFFILIQGKSFAKLK